MTIEQIQQNINEVEQNLHAHNYAEAEVQAQSLLNEAMIEENSELQAQLLYIIGDSLLRRGLSKDALPYFERTERIAENNAIKSLQLKVFGSLGIVYETLADFAQCMEYYEKALELSQEIDDKRSTAKNYLNIGIVHYTLGNYIKSLEYFHKALDINEKLHNNQGIMSALVNIGSLYARLNDYPKALEYYDRGIVLNEMVGNTMGVAILLTNMGNVYKNMTYFSQALECLNKALILCEQIDNKEGLSIIFDSMGMIYADQSQYSQSLSYFEKSLAINEELGDHVAIAASFGNIARLMTNVDYEGYSKEKAEYYYEKALALSNELKLQDHLCFLHNSIAKFYKHEKEWEKYSYHIEQYHSLEKEVQSLEVKKQADRFDLLRQIMEKEKARAIAERDGEIQRLKAEELARNIALMKKELEELIERLVRKSQFIRSISGKLEYAMSLTNGESRRAVYSVIELLDERVGDEEDRIVVLLQLRAVYGEFMSRLESLYKELNDGEIKTCALMMMQLSTSKIAITLGVSERTVEKYRSTIRKKLGIAAHGNIVSFLQQFLEE
ncbi:MAG: tetratricopeptide repeat protein [Ignavibacteria bacterium]|nr:tetratricopeptide repeat protein [Ignavibacteria bacterium]